MSSVAIRARKALISSIIAGAAVTVLGSTGVRVLAGCSAWSSARDLRAQIATARTPADHEAIARALMAEAERYAADARYHHKLAATYEESGRVLWERHHIRSDLRIAEHCETWRRTSSMPPPSSQTWRASMRNLRAAWRRRAVTDLRSEPPARSPAHVPQALGRPHHPSRVANG